MSWYDEFFTETVWLVIQDHFFGDDANQQAAQDILKLLDLKAGDAALDVPCGTGRIACALAKSGLQVTGIDLIPHVIERAAQRADALGVDLALEQRDMRDIKQRGAFDAVLNCWGSFGYFDDEGNEAFAAAAYRALKRGGQLLVETPCVEGAYQNTAIRDWWTIEDMHVLRERSLELELGVEEDRWTFIRGGEVSTHSTRRRLYTAPELRGLMARVGFSKTRIYSDLKGSPFKLGGQLVMVATK